MTRKLAEIRLANVDRLAVEAALEFANARVESADQVLKIFRRLPLPRDVWRTVPPESVRDFREHDQRELRSWLDEIVRKGNVAPAVRDEVARRVRDTVGVVRTEIVFEGGVLQARVTPSFGGVQACYSYAVALLVSRNADRSAKRLGLCDRCGRFFFDARVGVGRRRDYCSPEHKNQLGVWRHANPHKKWMRPPLPA